MDYLSLIQQVLQGSHSMLSGQQPPSWLTGGTMTADEAARFNRTPPMSPLPQLNIEGSIQRRPTGYGVQGQGGMQGLPGGGFLSGGISRRPGGRADFNAMFGLRGQY